MLFFAPGTATAMSEVVVGIFDHRAFFPPWIQVAEISRRGNSLVLPANVALRQPPCRMRTSFTATVLHPAIVADLRWRFLAHA